MSQLNFMQRSALNRIGNVICPGDDNFPSFRELDVVHHHHILLSELPESDVKDLKLLLTLFFFIPAPVIAFKLMMLEKMKNLGGPIGTLVRMLLFGLRGLVFALYYSGKLGPKAKVTRTPVEIVGFEVSV